MFYQIDLDEELKQVERAAQYYLNARDILRSLHDDTVNTYYRSLFTTTSDRNLNFKALFFAMRLQPVLTYIAAFQQTHNRPPQILDIGCGFGLESILLVHSGAQVHGLDGSDAKIAGAEKLRAAYEAAFANQLKLTYQVSNLFQFHPERQFDAVYSSATLHHIEPISEAILTIADFLAPGGTFFLSDENGYSPAQQVAVQKRIGWTSSRKYWQTNHETGEKFLYGNENIRAPFQWIRHVRKAGMHPETIKYCRFLPPVNWPIDRLVRAERRLRRIPLVTQLWAIGFLLTSRKP
ncbi:MAG: class I SAM-dependent methyltransferase [Anaerolineaceae bacterium]|nr:class I SAM-dependent methyltransferase [Anaerolineaceae bacterium]